jgi:hypothetical protein
MTKRSNTNCSCRRSSHGIVLLLITTTLLFGQAAQPINAFSLSKAIDFLLFGNRPIFPFLQCGLKALLLLGVDPGSFERYDAYFRNESVVHLAQTGSFQGAMGIKEYVQFAFSKTSPFFRTGPNNYVHQIRFDSYKAETGQCAFLQISRWDVTMDPSVSLNDRKPYSTWQKSTWITSRATSPEWISTLVSDT